MNSGVDGCVCVCVCAVVVAVAVVADKEEEVLCVKTLCYMENQQQQQFLCVHTTPILRLITVIDVVISVVVELLLHLHTRMLRCLASEIIHLFDSIYIYIYIHNKVRVRARTYRWMGTRLIRFCCTSALHVFFLHLYRLVPQKNPRRTCS